MFALPTAVTRAIVQMMAPTMVCGDDDVGNGDRCIVDGTGNDRMTELITRTARAIIAVMMLPLIRRVRIETMRRQLLTAMFVVEW